MPFYAQGDRPLGITTPLGQDTLLLTGLQGFEAISELFLFQLDLIAEAGTPVPFDRILGQKVTVELQHAVEEKGILAGLLKASARKVATSTS